MKVMLLSALAGAFALTAPGWAAAQAAAESATIRATTNPPAIRTTTPGGKAARATPVNATPAAGTTMPTDPLAVASPIPNIDNGPACVGGLPQPVEVRISAGKATLVNMAEAITRRTLGDPSIAEGRMVSPTVLYLVSGRIGTTNAILQGSSGRCVLLDVVVGIDTAAVQAKLAELMPNEKGIVVTAAADSIVLSGVVSDALAADRAVSVANAYVMAAYQQGLGQQGAMGTNLTRLAEAGGSPQMARIVNLLSVGASHQVMLEVKVAEVSKNLLDKLGASLGMQRTNGDFTYQLVTNLLFPGINTIGTVAKNAANQLNVQAQVQDGLVRILAEPNVMAISGQEGSFLAGGKILIPVGQETTGGLLRIVLEEKEFGVGLKFTPTVLGDGRINLKVAPEVSELSRDGVALQTTQSSSLLPLITTRRASTTIQLYDGQSFAIGGLMKSSSAGTVKALPVLGQLPIIGALFRSSDFQSEKTELVFIVTPRLVKPLAANHPLPTDVIGEPDRRDVLLNGRLDSGRTDGVKPASTDDAAKPNANKEGGMELK